MGDRLAAPLLVARDGAQICNLHDDAIKWTLVVWRVRVCGASHSETPPTCIPRTYA